MSEGTDAPAATGARARSFDFEQLEPSAPPPGNPAARLLAQAAAEAEGLRRSAREQGHEQGRAAGHEQGLGEVQDAARALSDALASLQQLRAELADRVEADAVELALALAGKILAGAIDVRPELIAESVRGALRRIGERRSVSVLVNPQDLELLDAVRARDEALAGLQLHGEERVARGSAVVRSEEGEVDASVQTQLERAREVVRAELQLAP